MQRQRREFGNGGGRDGGDGGGGELETHFGPPFLRVSNREDEKVGRGVGRGLKSGGDCGRRIGYGDLRSRGRDAAAAAGLRRRRRRRRRRRDGEFKLAC